MLVACLLQSRAIAANHYVLFKNGHMFVFPDSCLSNWQTKAGKMVFTALDGTQYSYSLGSIVSCTETSPRELPSFTSFKFNNKYNYQVVGDATGTIDGDVVNIEVLGLGKRLTPSFNITSGVDGLEAMAWVDGVKQVSKESRLRFDGDVTYLVGYPGDKVLAPQQGNTFELVQYGRTYTVRTVFPTTQATAVPRIDINTVNGEGIVSKEHYLDAEIIIDGAGVFPSMTDSVQVKGRGNSSWSANPNAKNPYRLKFANKRKPLGLKNAKSWILLANILRGSMLANPIGMKLASLLGLPAVNHMIPVDLYVNGTYKGSYTFTEKVGFSNNSIDDVNEEVAALIELDSYFDEALTQMYASPRYNLPVMVQYPEFGVDSSSVTLNIVKQRLNAFESAVYNGGDIEPHVNVESLVRFMLLNEFIMNREIFFPKSTYFYHTDMMSDTGRFVFGPAWDLDYTFGFDINGNYFYANAEQDFYQTTNHKSGWRFFSKVHSRDEVGCLAYKVMKDFVRDGLDELCEFCQDYYEFAAPSLQSNGDVWPMEKFNYGPQASTQAPNWLRQRAQYMLSQLAAIYRVPGDVNGDEQVTLEDLTLLINYLLTDDATDVDLENADYDGDGIVNLGDMTDLINFLLTAPDRCPYTSTRLSVFHIIAAPRLCIRGRGAVC